MSNLPRMHALLVGNGVYEEANEFDELKYAPADAEHLHGLLTGSPSSLFSRDTSFWRQNLSLTELQDLLPAFFEPVVQSDLVLCYFAGHARVMPNGRRLFLVMRDTSPDALASSAFSVDRFIDFFDERRLGRYAVVLDCCYAQKALKSPGVRFRGELPPSPVPEWCGQGKVLVAATGEYQLAHEMADLEHGLFSFYFAEALETGNSTDPSKQFINIMDVCAYAGMRIAANHPDVNQKPNASGEDIAGELIIARNPRFERGQAYQAEILDYIKQSLNVADLSDKDRVEAARIRKLRKFIDRLKEKVTDDLRQFLQEVMDYGDALGLAAATVRREFDDCLAALAFSTAAELRDVAAVSSPGRGRAMLFSAAHGSRALESPELNSGLFSFYFREALLGKASTEEGFVTLTSSFRYLLEHVRGYEHFAQNPVLVSNISQDPIITGKGIDWTRFPGKRIAVLVGVDEYASREISPLQYAESDVNALSQILSSLGGFECHVFVGQGAGEAVIQQALASILRQVSEQDVFLFYFTGHGFSTDNDGYAILYDSDFRNPTRALRVSTLAQALEESRAGTSVLVFDTCMAPAELPHLQAGLSIADAEGQSSRDECKRQMPNNGIQADARTSRR